MREELARRDGEGFFGVAFFGVVCLEEDGRAEGAFFIASSSYLGSFILPWSFLSASPLNITIENYPIIASYLVVEEQ